MSSSAFLSTMDRYSRLLRQSLGTVGCLPNAAGNFNMVFISCVLVLLIYYFMAITSVLLNAMPDDFNQITYTVAPLLGVLLIIVKYIMYIFRRTDNHELIKFIDEYFWIGNIESPARERKIIEQYGRFTYLFNIVQMVAIFSPGFSWCILPLVDMLILQRQSDHDQPFHLVLPFDHAMPFNLDLYSHPFYEMFYLLQILVTFFGATALTGIDCLYVHYMMHTCAQFEILQMRLEEFDKDEDGLTLSLKDQENKLATCIELHTKLLIFCQKLEDLLNKTVFCNFFVGIGFLCFNAFVVKMFPGNTFIYLQTASCVFATVCQMFFQCYPADYLTTQGLKVALAAYSSNWFNAPNHIKKEILFIIMRAQRPVYITVGGVTPVSLGTYESYLRAAASYFTFLSSMSDEN